MILATTFVYNERKYLPEWVKWYRKNGCELFVLDNYSNDGTWEWLQKLGIPSARIDTNEEFHLHVLQDELMRHIEKINPDWVVYTGADLFAVTDKPLNETISEADISGHNQIMLPCYNALWTGEDFNRPMQKHFTRGNLYRNLVMIAKYGPGFTIRNDNIGVDDKNPTMPEGIMINYGGCKPPSEQKEKLRRRQKAWDSGLPKNVGKHFAAGQRKGWKYKKTTNLLDTYAGQYIKKLW